MADEAEKRFANFANDLLHVVKMQTLGTPDLQEWRDQVKSIVNLTPAAPEEVSTGEVYVVAVLALPPGAVIY